jgi:hypothetical protein
MTAPANGSSASISGKISGPDTPLLLSLVGSKVGVSIPSHWCFHPLRGAVDHCDTRSSELAFTALNTTGSPSGSSEHYLPRTTWWSVQHEPTWLRGPHRGSRRPPRWAPPPQGGTSTTRVSGFLAHRSHSNWVFRILLDHRSVLLAILGGGAVYVWPHRLCALTECPIDRSPSCQPVEGRWCFIWRACSHYLSVASER